MLGGYLFSTPEDAITPTQPPFNPPLNRRLLPRRDPVRQVVRDDAGRTVMPDTGDDREGADVRWVSYDELASIRGIDKTSAFRMAHRRRWPKRKGNDGTVRLAVPVSDLQARARVDQDVRSDDRADVRFEKPTAISVLQSLIAAKDAQIEALHGWLAAETGRADRAEEQAERAEDRAHRAEQRLIDELARLAGGQHLPHLSAPLPEALDPVELDAVLADLRSEFEESRDQLENRAGPGPSAAAPRPSSEPPPVLSQGPELASDLPEPAQSLDEAAQQDAVPPEEGKNLAAPQASAAERPRSAERGSSPEAWPPWWRFWLAKRL